MHFKVKLSHPLICCRVTARRYVSKKCISREEESSCGVGLQMTRFVHLSHEQRIVELGQIIHNGKIFNRFDGFSRLEVLVVYVISIGAQQFVAQV